MQLRGDMATSHEREVILRQAQHLVRLVDDLLDVSRVARGKVDLAKKPLELAAVVAKAVEATGPLLEQRRHRLYLSVPSKGLPIEADEVRLTQVINNLLTNAARYTPPGGQVEVTGTREDNAIVLRVRDNGIGIDPMLLSQVFGMRPQCERSYPTLLTTLDATRIIAPKSRINRPANESSKCADSNLPFKRSGSCLPTVSSRISSGLGGTC
jgi:K+-sensing histidine kinase KdpD